MPKVGQSDLTGVGFMQETGVAAAHARQKSQMGKKLWNHGAGRCGYGSWSLISQDVDVLFMSEDQGVASGHYGPRYWYQV